jgi:HK97 gp10 family phage protein
MRVRARVVRNDLGRIADGMDRKAVAVVRKTALDIEADAKGRAPVDTGALRNSIQTTMAGDMSAVVAPGVDYAIFVEFGTARMAARPYLIPAAEAHRQPFIDAMKAIVRP